MNLDNSLILIETYWNVNVKLLVRLSKPSRILIETYWNVNNKPILKIIISVCILIETYWNVNDGSDNNGKLAGAY